jgi:hypothetical protein
MALELFFVCNRVSHQFWQKHLEKTSKLDTIIREFNSSFKKKKKKKKKHQLSATTINNNIFE